MSDKRDLDEHVNSGSDLRAAAEEKLGKSLDAPQELKYQTPEDIIHELRVHKVELEMQNEELKRIQLVLEASTNKYQDLYDFAPVGYFTLTQKGIIKDVNLTGASLLGTPRPKLIGRGFGHFIAPESEDQWYQYIMSGLKQEDKQSCVLTLKSEDGSSFYTRFESIRMDAPAEQVDVSEGAYVIRMVVSDITERKRWEEERLEMQHKLLQAQKLEGLAVMAGGIAHDFNNQLTAVLGNLELALMDRALEPKARQNIENAITAAKRSAEFSRQMQIYAGNAVHLPVDLDLNELAHKNEDLLKSAVSKTTTLHFEIDKGLPFICGDADQIQLIITNLIMNASEAIGDKDGDVTLTTGVMDCDEAYLGRSRLEDKPEPGRFVFLGVTDPGCGMDAETQRRLFDPFFSTKFWGRGLGMATVLGITKGHHGAIIVDSEVGKGTTIRVLFPASAQDRAPSLQDRSVVAVKDSRSDSGAGRKTILVVDDDEMVRDYCVEFLELLGYDTIAAADGEEGVRIVRERLNEIALVLLDFVMPKMNGAEAFMELTRIKPDVKVLLSSGYTEDVMRQRFPGRQPASILHKPYDMETLKAELERLLGTAD